MSEEPYSSSSSSAKRKLDETTTEDEDYNNVKTKISKSEEPIVPSKKGEWPSDETEKNKTPEEAAKQQQEETPIQSVENDPPPPSEEQPATEESTDDPPKNEDPTTTTSMTEEPPAPKADDNEKTASDQSHSSSTALIVEASQKQEAEIISGQSEESSEKKVVETPPSPAEPAAVVDPTVSSITTSDSMQSPSAANNSTTVTTTTITKTTTSMPTTTADTIVEEKASLLPEYVGRVIGKGGEMIRDLQARSGCKIDVDQNVPHGAPRIISYKGPKAKVEFAKHLIHMLSVQNVGEDNLPLGEAKEEVLVVPATVVGKVIGRGGEMIRELQSKSHAKIQVDHSNRHGLSQDQKRVAITGNAESVAKAKEMILFLTSNPLMEAQQALSMLIQEKTRAGAQWGSGPPYPNLPNHGVNMHPQSAGAPPPNNFGGFQGGTNPAMFSAQSQSMYAPPHQQQPPFYSAGHELIYVSKQYMGRIIGGKGVTINDLQKRSNCSIQINQNVAPGQDCEVTITGNPQGVEAAKQMIQHIIQAGPNHPYAGGAPPQQQQYGGPAAYGGGGGGMYGGYGGGMPPQQMQQAYVAPQQQMYAPYDHRQQQQQAVPPQQSYGYGAAAPVQQLGAYMQQHPQQQQLPYGYSAPVVAQPPSAWKSATSADGKVYYYNEQTGETQWEKPPGMP